MNLREQLEKEITDKVMTKLASEKVELGLIDDLKSGYNSLRKEYDKQNKNAQSALAELKKVGADTSKLDLKFMDWLVDFNNAEDSAKDLGIKLPSDILKAEKEIIKNNIDAKTLVSVINKIKI
jgi:hypothetical protein